MVNVDSKSKSVDGVSTAVTPHGAVVYPSFLMPVEQTGADLVLVPRDPVPGFRPNIVLTSVESTAPLVDASVTALKAHAAQHPLATIVALSPWLGSVDSATPIGRWNTFFYAGDDELDVMVEQWVWATGTHHLSLVASFLPSQAEMVASTFQWIAAQFALGADLEAVLAAAGARGEAALDEALSEQVGFPVEDVSFVANPRPDPTASLPFAAMDLLARSYARPRLGAPHGALGRQGRGTLEARTLIDSGLADERGRVSDAGGVIMSLFSMRPPTLQLWRTTSDGVVETRATVSAGTALVVNVGHETQRVDLYQTSAEKIPSLVAQLIGLRPSFTVGEAESITQQELDARMANGWAEIRIVTASGVLAILQAPDGQTFTLDPPVDGQITTIPLPGREVIGMVITTIDRAVAATYR